METTTEQTSLHSPFALMFPDTAKEILKRAENMVLPRRYCRPLSKAQYLLSPRQPLSTLELTDD